MTALDAAAAPLRRLAFEIPDDMVATEPPEARGLARDEVRLLVAGDGVVRHVLFHDLASLLDPGDLLVVNTSATLPAAVDGRAPDGSPTTVHFSSPWSARDWIVELRLPDGGRNSQGRAGEGIELPGNVWIHLEAAYPDTHLTSGSRLWRAKISGTRDVEDYLHRNGRPITYGYVKGRWPLAMYQTIFAAEPGSAEMPSAARPFSTELVARLAQHAVVIAPVTLHTGVSSLEAGETPLPERYRVPAATARLVASTRAGGGRVIAVGTTAARALETAAGEDGGIAPASGWTELVLGPERPSCVLDGIITGWHDHDASHLELLEAVAGSTTVSTAYREALLHRYRWHEFGDSALLLRPRQV